jgi:hypothetical protein
MHFLDRRTDAGGRKVVDVIRLLKNNLIFSKK